MLFCESVLALLGAKLGPHILQLLGGYEGHVTAQVHGQVRKLPFELIQSAADGADYPSDRLLQKAYISALPVYDLLPVPLVHIDRVEIVQLLVPAYGVHVRHKAVAHIEAVVVKGQPLPLCQGVHHLAVYPHGGDVEAHRALHAVEVIVKAR